MNNRSKSLRDISYRVLDKSSKTQGVSFLLTPCVLATCNHVINACGVKQGELISVRSNSISDGGEKSSLEAVVLVVDNKNDVALLKFTQAIRKPEDLLVFDKTIDFLEKDHKFVTFGHAITGGAGERWDSGGSIGGLTAAPNPVLYENKLIQLSKTDIEKGFSGAPVKDVNTGLVIGMITAFFDIDKPDTSSRIGYAITMETIWKLLPDDEKFEYIQINTNIEKSDSGVIQNTPYASNLNIHWEKLNFKDWGINTRVSLLCWRPRPEQKNQFDLIIGMADGSFFVKNPYKKYQGHQIDFRIDFDSAKPTALAWHPDGTEMICGFDDLSVGNRFFNVQGRLGIEEKASLHLITEKDNKLCSYQAKKLFWSADGEYLYATPSENDIAPSRLSKKERFTSCELPIAGHKFAVGRNGEIVAVLTNKYVVDVYNCISDEAGWRPDTKLTSIRFDEEIAQIELSDNGKLLGILTTGQKIAILYRVNDSKFILLNRESFLNTNIANPRMVLHPSGSSLIVFGDDSFLEFCGFGGTLMGIFVSAIAEALFGVIFNDAIEIPWIKNLRKKWLTDDKKEERKQALKNAIEAAYRDFEQKFPDEASAFFDKDFLMKESVVIELSKALTVDKSPSPHVLINLWKKELNTGMELNRDAVTFFLDHFMDCIKNAPELKPEYDSRSLERIGKNTETVSGELKKISELLENTNQTLVTATKGNSVQVDTGRSEIVAQPENPNGVGVINDQDRNKPPKRPEKLSPKDEDALCEILCGLPQFEDKASRIGILRRAHLYGYGRDTHYLFPRYKLSFDEGAPDFLAELISKLQVFGYVWVSDHWEYPLCMLLKVIISAAGPQIGEEIEEIMKRYNYRYV